MESRGTASIARAELVVTFLLEADPNDFRVGEERVTVETDLVDSVVVASVSTKRLAASAAVDEAFAVSAADRSGRAQEAVSVIAANAAATDNPVIARFPEESEAPSVCVATLSPTLLW